MDEPDILTNHEGINSEAIFKAIEQLKTVGPVFTSMSMPKLEYDLLASQAGKSEDLNPIGIRISVNPLLPAQMVCAYDTEGNLWIIDLRAPDKMHNLGRTDRIFKLDFEVSREYDDFFNP